jgi:hypothetical protein
MPGWLAGNGGEVFTQVKLYSIEIASTAFVIVFAAAEARKAIKAIKRLIESIRNE